ELRSRPWARRATPATPLLDLPAAPLRNAETTASADARSRARQRATLAARARRRSLRVRAVPWGACRADRRAAVSWPAPGGAREFDGFAPSLAGTPREPRGRTPAARPRAAP